MKRRAELEPGFVLHTYPYKETSLIVEAFTRRHGRVGLLARGARRPRSAMRGVLLAFHPLRLGWSGSAELANLMQAEWGGALQPLAGRGLMCGFYLNELILRLLPREDPHETLFDVYAEALARLSAGDAYAGVLRASRGDLRVSGRTLLDLAADDYSRSETRDEARYLMRALIGQRLHGQVLHTRSVLMELNEL